MLKELRYYFGLPQNVLADYLGVSRSQLSMIEIGKRSMMAQKTLALFKFYQAITEQPDATPAPNPLLDAITAKQQANYQSLCTRQLADCQYRLAKAQRTLTRLLEDRARATLILERMDTLTSLAVTPEEQSLVELIAIENKQLLQRTGKDAELPLCLEICALEAQLGYLQAQNQ